MKMSLGKLNRDINRINILNINSRKWNWVYIWPLRYIFTQYGMPYWGYINPKDVMDISMTYKLMERHRFKYKWFKFLSKVDEKFTKYFNPNNYIREDIPF